MTYIENIFVCIAAPLLVAAFCMGRKYFRFFLFAFAGMGACLISAYVNTFFAALYGAAAFNATVEIAPVVEEIIKFLPMLFYLLVFEPEPEKTGSAVFTVAAGFATFENICYLIQRSRGSGFPCDTRLRNGSHAHRLRSHRGLWAYVCLAARVAESSRYLRPAGDRCDFSRYL